MPSFDIVDNDGVKKPVRQGNTNNNGSYQAQAQNGMNIIYVVIIMGVVIMGALYFTAPEPCPELNCSVIPACPQVNMSQFSCPACPSLTCTDIVCTNTTTTQDCEGVTMYEECQDFVNDYVNLNITMTIMNSTDYSQNVTYQMTKDSNGIYDTTELNSTHLNELLGEYWVIQTEVN